MKKRLLFLAFLALAACQQAPADYIPTPLVFNGAAPIRVNVAEIRVVESYQSPRRLPNVEQDFPTPPAEALKQWVKQRVTAVGTQGILEIAITDASVREAKLPKTQGVKGLFTDDQDARYDAHLAVTMNLLNGRDPMSAANANVTVSRSKSINEKATLNERLRLYDGMTQDMMALYDREATARFQQYFAAYLR